MTQRVEYLDVTSFFRKLLYTETARRTLDWLIYLHGSLKWSVKSLRKSQIALKLYCIMCYWWISSGVKSQKGLNHQLQHLCVKAFFPAYSLLFSSLLPTPLFALLPHVLLRLFMCRIDVNLLLVCCINFSPILRCLPVLRANHNTAKLLLLLSAVTSLRFVLDSMWTDTVTAFYFLAHNDIINEKTGFGISAAVFGH